MKYETLQNSIDEMDTLTNLLYNRANSFNKMVHKKEKMNRLEIEEKKKGIRDIITKIVNKMSEI
jgi:hypothetical protein